MPKVFQSLQGDSDDQVQQTKEVIQWPFGSEGGDEQDGCFLQMQNLFVTSARSLQDLFVTSVRHSFSLLLRYRIFFNLLSPVQGGEAGEQVVERHEGDGEYLRGDTEPARFYRLSCKIFKLIKKRCMLHLKKSQTCRRGTCFIWKNLLLPQLLTNF